MRLTVHESGFALTHIATGKWTIYLYDTRAERDRDLLLLLAPAQGSA